MRDFFDGSCKIRLLSDTHGYTPTGVQSSTTSQLQLHLPEVWSPAQYLIDVGLRPALARRLSSTYIGVVDQYRNICQSHFDRATHGDGGHLTEYYREVFIILFKRTVQAWGSQIVSIARVQLCQAGAPRATVCPERVDVSTVVVSKAPRDAKFIISQIRVDDATKAEIIARLGLKETHFISDTVGFNPSISFYNLIKLCQVVTGPSAGETLRLEKVSEQTHTLSTDRVNSRLMVCCQSLFCTLCEAHLRQVVRVVANLVDRCHFETPRSFLSAVTADLFSCSLPSAP